MQIEPLSLTHQDFLEKSFKEINLSLSDYSFANLYLFRNIHNYEILKIGKDVFIKGLTRDKVRFIMLTTHPSHYSSDSIRSALMHGKILYPIPESWLHFFTNENMQRSFKDEDSDYLFSRSKLSAYPGRHLSKKRNLIKQLRTHHQIQAVNFIDQKEDARIVLQNWLNEHQETPIETDYEECLEAIQSFNTLHLHGRIVYVDGIPRGLTIGEKISHDCFVVHFCKGSKNIKGLYQFLYQDIAQNLEENCIWINLEQDLGILSIRDSKHSYKPDRFLLKWRLYPNLI